jgi:hypothetical protein
MLFYGAKNAIKASYFSTIQKCANSKRDSSGLGVVHSSCLTQGQ